MSYSPSEAVEAAEARVKFLRAVAKEYPHAVRDENGVWYADMSTDGCELELGVVETVGGVKMPIFRLYRLVGGGRLYVRQYVGNPYVVHALDELKRLYPDAYEKLAGIVRKIA